MQKIAIATTLIMLLGACTNPFSSGEKDIHKEKQNNYKTQTAFDGLYQKNLEHKAESIEKWYEKIGLSRYEKISDGTMESTLKIPNMLSFSLQSKYEGLNAGRDAKATFSDVKVDFDSLVSSGSISVDEIGLLSKSGESYLMFKNIVDAGMMDKSVRDIVKKYEGAWLQIQNTQNMTKEQLMGYNVGKNFMLKSPREMMQYFIEYPIFKAVSDKSEQNGMRVWKVDLDHANIVALIGTLVKDLSGEEISAENMDTIKKDVSAMSFSGILGFDPKNAKNATLSGVVMHSGSVVSHLNMSRIDSEFSLSFSDAENDAKMLFASKNIDTNQTVFTGTMLQGATEKMKLTGQLIKDKEKLKKFEMDVTVEGMTASIEHTVDGEKFNGKLGMIAGTIDWSGTTNKDGLIASLKISGVSPLGSLNMDLQEGEDGVARGPLTIKYADQTINADIGLQLQKEKSMFMIDLKGTPIPVYFDIKAQGKVSPSKEIIDAPKDVKSFQDFVKSLNELSDTLQPNMPPKIDPMMDLGQASGSTTATLPQVN